MITLEESLILAQPSEGKRLYKLRLGELSESAVAEMVSELPEDSTLILIKPPFAIVEAWVQPAGSDLLESFEDQGFEIEKTRNMDSPASPIDPVETGDLTLDFGDADDSATGEGFELSDEDWSNMQLISEGRADSIDELSIEWLIKAGMARRGNHGQPSLTPTARAWVSSK